jgi:predicted Fe-Mo cluster-binding NifX family protein
MKYALPTDDGTTVGQTFGRAKSFAIHETTRPGFLIVPNEGANAEHGAGTGAIAFLAEKGVTLVLAPELGPKAATALKGAGMLYEATTSGLSLEEALGASLDRATASRAEG